MKDDTVLISVVIPVKDGVPWLDDCIHGIMKQTLFPQTEIIVIDSGSTDGTLELLEKYPVHVHRIDSSEFNHGLTRNYGVQFCKGEYIVMTVQDAKPVDNKWLEHLLNGFTATQNVAAVCGQQVVPHEIDKNPVSWFRPYSKPSLTFYHFNTPGDFDKLSPLEKKNCCSWDDVTAMYRKSILQQLPFKKITYGEDAVWAKEALRTGHTLVYNSAAMVYHYHNEDWNFTFKRAFTTMYLRYKQFGYLYPEPKQSIRTELSIIKTIWQAYPFALKECFKWITYNKNQYKAAKEAYKVFKEALSKSEEELDAVHIKYCGIPPSPLKNNLVLVN